MIWYNIIKYICLNSYYLSEYNKYINGVYSAYTITNCTYYISDKIGLIDYVKKKINNKNDENIIIICEKCSSIKSDDEEYIIIDLYKS